MGHDWKRWFEGYASDWQTGEVAAVADRYAPVFMTASPTKTATYQNDERFRAWLRGVGEWHSASGLERVEVVTTREQPLGDHHVLVSVIWAIGFRKTGAQRIQFEISYLLTGEPPRILTLLSHHDQRAAMRHYGVLPG